MRTNLDFEEVFRRTVDLLKGLMARIGNGLHFVFVERFCREFNGR